MKDIVSTTSQFIENQFPDIFRTEGDTLVAFVKAYYEYLEQNSDASTRVSRDLLKNTDIDTTLDEFIIHFKEKYLKDFPFVTATDKRFLIKNIMDFYRSKGSERSLQLLMRLVFNEDVELYYPGSDILRPSASKWYVPYYLEASTSNKAMLFTDTQIVGTTSKAKAFVEGVVRKMVNGKLIDIIYLSNIRGRFIEGDILTNDGNLEGCPRVLGSLVDITLTNGGQDNRIGDVFDVISSEGKKGKARVSQTQDATGLIRFEIEDGGFGFSSDSLTQVYVSDGVLKGNNESLGFLDFESVYQPIEEIRTLSSEDINASAQIGDYVVGYGPSGGVVANSTIVAISNTNSSFDIVDSSSSYSKIDLYVNDGTFTEQITIGLVSNTDFYIGETIKEGDDINLTIGSINGTFDIGEEIKQLQLEDVANTVVRVARGKLVSVSGSEMELEDVIGEFKPDFQIVGSASGADTSVSGVGIVTEGASGNIVANTASDEVFVNEIVGAFTTGKNIYGLQSSNINEVANTNVAGAVSLSLNGDLSSNGVISDSLSISPRGILIGQNTSAIGVSGNSDPFYEGFDVKTERFDDFNPPLDANNEVIEYSMFIDSVGTGSDATFRIGSLDGVETITLNTDLMGANNVAGQPYAFIGLDASNSGIGFVDSVIVNDGGSDYSNGTIISFSGGGRGDGDPFVNANAVISTDGTGSITAITLTSIGQGYYSVPDFDLGGTTGSTANVELDMQFGYGFPSNPTAGPDEVLEDLLTFESTSLGTIGLLTGINPGNNYNTDQFVRIINPFIASYNKRDLLLRLDTSSGNDSGTDFLTGEIVTQTVGASTFSATLASANSTALILDRDSFNEGFEAGTNVVGSESISSANVISVEAFSPSRPIGDNADITATAISANGIATQVQIIDSGYGHISNELVQLESDSDFIITGNAIADLMGFGEGSWTSKDSHLNESSRIQDGRYYQEFSYDVISGLSIDKYRDMLKDVFHVGGTEMFGSIVKSISSSVDIQSNIEIELGSSI